MQHNPVSVHLPRADFLVSADPRYAAFWQSVQDGRWEPDTFQALQEHVRPEDAYLDIGTWIGPTVLFAARLARRAIAVEPDPVACAALLANLALNPTVAERTEVFAVALGPETGLLDLRTQEFGDSMTSALPGRGGRTITVSAIEVAPFLARALNGEASAFLKIDVEGAEYDLAPRICDWLEAQAVRADLLVSMHGHFFGEGLEANLARHYELLRRLAAFGTIRVWNGAQWATDTVQATLTDALARTGGFYGTVLVKGR